jgi:hypothetical protein
MRFYVGQAVRIHGPYFYGGGAVVTITDINIGMEYPIRVTHEILGWSDTFTEDGLLYDDEPKDSMNSVYIEPLTKLERLLMGLE